MLCCVLPLLAMPTLLISRSRQVAALSEEQMAKFDDIAELDAARPPSQFEWWLPVRRDDDEDPGASREQARSAALVSHCRTARPDATSGRRNPSRAARTGPG